MSTLALNIRMQGKLAVVIGGGVVALRKLRTLLATGASIRVVAMHSCSEIVELAGSGALAVRTGSYLASDLDDAFLAVAATDNAQVNAQVAADAREQGILVTVADNPAVGDIIFPATLHRSDLEITVSTGGCCPTFAVAVRDRIAEHIGHEYGPILGQLAVKREKLLTNGRSSTYNKGVLRSLARRLLDELTERKGSLP